MFETRHDTRTAGTGFSPADIALEASASALEATATRGFDFMEDMPVPLPPALIRAIFTSSRALGWFVR